VEPPALAETRAAAPQLLKLLPLGAVLVALLVVYLPVVTELGRDWLRDSNYSHGFLIPLVSVYLLWASREALRRRAAAPSILGLLGILVAGALLILGTAGAEVFTQRMSLLLMIGSLVLFLYGWGHVRLVAFPIAFLFFAIPLPYVIYYSLTGPLQALAAKVAVLGLKATGVPAMVQGNMIHLPQTSLEVAEACSGIRSLYAFLAVGALVAQAMPIPLWGRLGVFLLTIPLSVAGNAIRVWGTGMGAYLVGPEAAHGTIHGVFGIIVFVVSLGIFVIVKQAVGRLWSSGRSSPS
jgi:exosortase A